jgi:predicted transcriptional regulator
MLREKGKYATSTQNRRIVWHKIIWPLILELDDVVFSLKQYQKKRDEICNKDNLKISEMSRGLVSLLQKGIIIKESDMYSIHYRLIPYMRVKAECDYSTAMNEVRMK